MVLGLERNTGGRRTRRDGFTLIELLVVVAVLALLISIVLPSYSHVKQLTYATATQSFIHQLESGCEAYHQDYKFYPGQDRESLRAMSRPDDASLHVAGSGPPWYLNMPDATHYPGPYWGRFTGSQILAQRLFGFNHNWVRFGQQDNADGGATSGNITRVPHEYAPYKAEYLDVPDSSGNTVSGAAGSILDRFSKPMAILYFPARAGMANKTYIKDMDDPTNRRFSAYHFGDNAGYMPAVDESKKDNPLVPLVSGATVSLSDFTGTIGDARYKLSGGSDSPNVQWYQTYRPDSFIIIGAGLDRKYLTDDDAINFNR